jgi:hypothetical protein
MGTKEYLGERLRGGVRCTLTWSVVRACDRSLSIPVLRYSRLSDYLYVGSAFGQLGRKFLQNAGIRHYVSLRTRPPQSTVGGNYLHLPTQDEAPIAMHHLARAISFIEDCETRGDKVYIHCRVGIGRAPTLAIAYLMYRGMPLGEAIALVRSVRPFILISPAQTEQLRHLANKTGGCYL